MADESVSWSGALLWPQPLPEGSVIDLSQVDAIGVWTYDWFRARPRQAVPSISVSHSASPAATAAALASSAGA